MNEIQTAILGAIAGLIITGIGFVIKDIFKEKYAKGKDTFKTGVNKKFEDQVKPVVHTELVPYEKRIEKIEIKQEKNYRELKNEMSDIKATNNSQIIILNTMLKSQYYSLHDQVGHAIQKCLDKKYRTYEDANNIEGLYAQYEQIAKQANISNGVTNSYIKAFRDLPFKTRDGDVKIEMTRKEYEERKKVYSQLLKEEN